MRRGRTLASRDIFLMLTLLWARPRRILRLLEESVAKNRMSSAFEVRILPRKHSRTVSATRDYPTRPDGSVVDRDDEPRAGVTYEAVAGLRPVFRPDGTVTAGNCCPLNDGAATLLVLSERKARDLGITPLARIVSTGVTALSPEIMVSCPLKHRGMRCRKPGWRSMTSTLSRSTRLLRHRSSRPIRI